MPEGHDGPTTGAETKEQTSPEANAESCPVDHAASSQSEAAKSKIVEVGWMIDSKSATFIYDSPEATADTPLPVLDPPQATVRRGSPPKHPKSVGFCPAVIDFEAQYFQVTAPVDLRLRITQDEKGNPSIINAAGSQATISKKQLNNMVYLMSRDRWRDPRYPVIQVSSPYRFVTDEPVWINQMPPFNHYRDPQWPGLVITGRFPLHIWPRSLMWAFEWRDPNKELIVKRGEPWYYVRFETQDPGRNVRLVEAEMTPELRNYCEGLDGVTNFVSQTFQLFKTASERRPAKLLTKKKRGAAAS